MTGSPSSPRVLTLAPPPRRRSAAPSFVAALLLAALIGRALGRWGRSRAEQGWRPAARPIAGVSDESTRILLQTIAIEAQALTGAELVAAGLGGDATHSFDIWAHVGMPPEQVREVGRPPRRVGLLAVVIEENRTVRLGDVRRHPGHRAMPPHHPPITSFLGVPIRVRGGVAGCLCLGNKSGGAEFTVDDQHMAEMLAARAGSAVEAAGAQRTRAGSNAWLQSVLDQMPEGVMVMDGRGRVTLQNSQMRPLLDPAPWATDRFGNPAAIDLRLPSGERLPPDDLPLVRAVADGELTVAREFMARGPDHGPVPVLISAAPILANDGVPTGAVMVCQDVSTLREHQRAREEWASIVAHDLRQPISVIALRSSLLLHGPLSREQRDSVDQIARSVHSLGRLVGDLMDASLLETDRLRVTLDRVDLGALLSDVARGVPVAAGRTRVETPADVRLFVRGDAQRLEQVIANLLSNAGKYAEPDTEIVADLRLEAGHAHLRVTNLGAGIPDDELPFIFNRFARARATGHSGVQGLGLGLYIAKGLVAAHHGRIWAESVPHDRTTFHVSLPLDSSPGPTKEST